MFNKKSIQPKMDLHNAHASINIPSHHPIHHQLKMIQLTERDLKFLKLFQPTVEQHITDIVEKFYEILSQDSNMTAIINEHSSFERLKVTLRRHVSEMFDGLIDESFLEKRDRIARVHVRIGLPTKSYLAAFQSLNLSLTQLIRETVPHEDDQYELISAVMKILNLEQQLVLEAFENIVEEMKQRI